MSEWYDGHIQLDPALPLEQSVKALPARWAVYLMSDVDDRPVQLLCVRNLRASVKRRLTYSGEELSKRVDYRGLVRHLRWKRVDGALESDLAYLDVARAVFPSGYRQMVTLRPTWWLHVDPAATFPRWTRSESPLAPAGSSPEHVAVGPLQEKGQAQRLIEMLEDGFDLCRYHHLLVQSPDAAACPYKDMGKCPAPCDGSVSMQQYRNLIAWSRDTLIDPADEIETQTERMREAAGELRFELAAKIKQFIDLLKSLRTGDNRFVRPFERFAFVAVQPAPSGQQAKLLLCTPAGTTELAGLISEPVEVLRHLTIPTDPRPIDLERLCILTHHLFQPKTGACFVPLDQLSDQTLRQAYRAACRQPSDGESDDEGIVREAAVVG
ncbi:MAG: hypothetical protein ACTHLZ_12110 [Tepidisphaeraceae bacterium]